MVPLGCQKQLAMQWSVEERTRASAGDPSASDLSVLDLPTCSGAPGSLSLREFTGGSEAGEEAFRKISVRVRNMVAFEKGLQSASIA